MTSYYISSPLLLLLLYFISLYKASKLNTCGGFLIVLEKQVLEKTFFVFINFGEK